MSLELKIGLIALLLSLLSLSLQALSIWRERVSLSVEQDLSEDAYAFPFVMYDRYDCLFFRMLISNKANSEVSVTRIVLIDKQGKKYTPESYDVPDYRNKDGISLKLKNDDQHYIPYNLRSENILDQLRIPPYGHVSGFAVFLHGPVIEKEEIFSVDVQTPVKKYRMKVKVSPLPNTIIPDHIPK